MCKCTGTNNFRPNLFRDLFPRSTFSHSSIHFSVVPPTPVHYSGKRPWVLDTTHDARCRRALRAPRRLPRAPRRSRHLLQGQGDQSRGEPIVVVARNVIGVKRFNQIRGKAIALHSQVSARGASILGPPFRPQSFLVWLDNKPDRVASSRRADVFDPSCFSSGYHRILQGDRRGRQGSPEPDPHGEEQRRSPRFLGVSRSAGFSGYG